MKKIVKLVLLLLVVLAAGAGAYLYKTAPLQVETEVLRPETATLTFTEQGDYAYDNQYDLYPLVSGEILGVHVKKGQTVKKGDVIAEVYDPDYPYQVKQLRSNISGYNAQIANLGLQEQKERDNAAVTLETLKGQLATLRAEMAKSGDTTHSIEKQIQVQANVVDMNQRNADLAHEYYRDVRDLDDETIRTAKEAYNQARSILYQSQLVLEQLRGGKPSEELYQAQESALETQIESTSALLEKGYSSGMQQYYQSQIEAAKLSIAQMTEKKGRATIYAPVAGVITDLPVLNKNIAEQQAPVAKISSEEVVETFIPVREIDGVKVGDQVDLLLDKRMGEKTIKGQVLKIEGEAQVKTSSLGVEERKIRALIQPKENALEIGYDIDVRFTVYTRQNALVVPKTAMFEKDGGDCVWIVKNGVLAVQKVTKGVETSDGCIIEKGLSAGDAVVVDADNENLAQGKRAQS